MLELARKVYRGERLTLWVLNRFEAARFAPDEPYIVVAIRDPDAAETPLLPSPLCRAVLRLQFHDRNRPRPERDDVVLMTPEDARTLLDFVRSHLPDVRTVVCHCNAGLGRSPAVAAALSHVVQDKDDFFFQNFAPNEWVYQNILRVDRHAPRRQP